MYFSPGGNNQFIILKILVAFKMKRKDIYSKVDFRVYQTPNTPGRHLKTSEESCTEARLGGACMSPSRIVLTFPTLSTRKKNLELVMTPLCGVGAKRSDGYSWD